VELRERATGETTDVALGEVAAALLAKVA
jgi:hypothetical protein